MVVGGEIWNDEKEGRTLKMVIMWINIKTVFLLFKTT